MTDSISTATTDSAAQTTASDQKASKSKDRLAGVSDSMNVSPFTGKSNRRKGVSLFHGWKFIRFCEGDEDCFSIMPRFDFNSPTIEYNPEEVTLEHLENPTHAPFWLPLAIDTICARVLAEAINDKSTRKGNLLGAGWDEFRDEVCKQTDRTMEELVDSALMLGFERTHRYMTSCMYYETGLHTAILSRQAGRPVLRSA